MKLLLDESIPRRLAAIFPETLEVTTVQRMGWRGTENGVLLQKAAESGFGALITADKGIEYQQNLETLPLAVIVLQAKRTRLNDLAPLVPEIVALLTEYISKGIYHVPA